MTPLVYVAGPYTRPDPVENTHNAVRAAEEIEALGCDVVIPHLSLLWHAISPAPLERWYERDLAVMRRCDALVRLPGVSTGADAEVAEFRGPVFFWPYARDDLASWIARRRLDMSVADRESGS